MCWMCYKFYALVAQLEEQFFRTENADGSSPSECSMASIVQWLERRFCTPKVAVRFRVEAPSWYSSNW